MSQRTYFRFSIGHYIDIASLMDGCDSVEFSCGVNEIPDRKQSTNDIVNWSNNSIGEQKNTRSFCHHLSLRVSRLKTRASPLDYFRRGSGRRARRQPIVFGRCGPDETRKRPFVGGLKTRKTNSIIIARAKTPRGEWDGEGRAPFVDARTLSDDERLWSGCGGGRAGQTYFSA